MYFRKNFTNILVGGIYMNRIFNEIIKNSIKKYINDIYILPRNNYFVLKGNDGVRIDDLNSSYVPTQRLINYCKFISGMSVSEKRRPQIGSLEFIYGDDKVFLRFSSVGNFQNQEAMVIRIIYPLNKIKLDEKNEDNLDNLINLSKNGGLILFSGKTGSGKTTSIYQLANKMKKENFVMTIEDPVEIIEEDFLQLQVNESAGIYYDDLIKVGLRSHPDIFIIGEIRDYKTAEAAIRASLSGHLVLTTVHSKSTSGTIARLKQLGCDYDDLKQSIAAVVFQQLKINDDESMVADMKITDYEKLFN